MQNHDRSVLSSRLRSHSPLHQPSHVESPLTERPQVQAALHTLLCRPDRRLLTIVGARGVGKTRMARAAAAQAMHIFADGVCVVELATLREPQLVLATIARALGLPLADGMPPLDALCAFLRDRAMLVVLDGFDQLRSAAPLLERLLQRTRNMRLLITSSTPLQITGEQTYLLAPLALPPAQSYPDLDALLRYEAVDLFVARAKAAQPGFTPTASDAQVIAALCTRLAGLPLAIELAAARMGEHSLQHLLLQLDARLLRLAEQGHALSAPQLALRAVVDWSVGLLTPAEQQLFGRLGLFAGSWNITAVDSVCIGWGGANVDSIDAMELMAGYGLLVRCPTPQERRRFRMPEALRPFALERLQADPVLTDLQRFHAEYYLYYAPDAPEQRDDAIAGLCAALGWALARGDTMQAQRICGVLWRLWRERGDLSEARRWVAQALTSRPGKRSLPSALRALVMVGAGRRALQRGNYVRAVERFEESLLLYEALDDCVAAAHTRVALGAALRLQGATTRSDELYAQGLAVLRGFNNRPGLRAALNKIASTALQLAAPFEAQPLCEQVLLFAQQDGDTHAEAHALRRLGLVAQQQGNNAHARDYYVRSLLLFLQRKEKLAAAQVMIDLAGALEPQQLELAARMLGSADQQCLVLGQQPLSQHPDNACVVKHIRKRCGNVYFEHTYRAGWWQDWPKVLVEACGAAHAQGAVLLQRAVGQQFIDGNKPYYPWHVQ